ncbi:hypothetical protein H9P43_009669 [Blastocladiella emersonii ATCC 22665]|nr:hypothetical protein H9P43_009669 [Blastocladiella emersonii ATCC 22665]
MATFFARGLAIEYEGMDEVFKYLADVRLTTLKATTSDRIKFDPGREFLMSKAISFEAFSLGGFRSEQLTGKCQFPTRGKTHADWVMYLTSDKKYRVGKPAAALHFTHNGTEHDVAIVEQFRVQDDAPGGGKKYKNIPVQTYVHVVPNYDRPAAPTTAGAANFKLDSEYREWLLNPFDCAGSAALMAYLWERDLLEVVV